MKKLLFIGLLLIVVCNSMQDEQEIIDFFKCLLLDSDVVYNHVNDLINAIKSLNPIKFLKSFISIYPAIIQEVDRCKKAMI